jgi:transposase-like protein
VLIMDTTYFWDIGIMVFKDSHSKKILHYELVKNETNAVYRKWVQELQNKGWKIEAIVCDGKKGLLSGFTEDGIPTQMCHFHQAAILRRYITKKPILEANKDLKWVWELLTCTDKESLEYYLGLFYQKHESFLNEKRINSKWKAEWVHKRTRSAYFSLKRNLKYLFCWYDYYWVIDIPNTTNALEWVFGHLKGKVSLHRGLKKERKIKLILSLLHWKN